jgi:hypothetical protein
MTDFFFPFVLSLSKHFCARPAVLRQAQDERSSKA